MSQKCELCCDSKQDDEKLIKLYFCPKCKSHNVRFVFELRNFFGVIPKMKCFDCGLEAPSFPVLVTNKKKLMEAKKKLIKKHRERRK